MANLQHLLLLLLHTTSVIAFIIDASSSLLRRKATNKISPLRLFAGASQDGLVNTPFPADNLTTRSPPIHWEYIHDAYRVRLTRKPNTSTTRPRNTGVSLYNWAAAVEDATSELENQRSFANVPWDATIAGGRFIYAAILRRQRTPAGAKRRLGFRIFADDLERHGLLYEEARIVLKAYAEYRLEWITPGGPGYDEVRMARFELFAQGFDDDVRFAYGGVELFVPPHSGGLSDLINASNASLSRDWS